MFTHKQVTQLLHPINPARVLTDGKGHAHVSQQDVTAHLIRVFGFGNFDIDVLNVDVVFERERTGQNGKPSNRFDVCYRAMVRLTVRGEGGECHYENGSTATAQNQTLGDAHDLAYKSAISLSIKRSAIALGDQFGLSLYNKGQRAALVRGTLVMPDAPDEEGTPEDVQDGVPQQVSLGNDEIEHEQDAQALQPDPPAEVSQDSSAADAARDRLREVCMSRQVPLTQAADRFKTRYGVDLKRSDDVAAIDDLAAHYGSK
ncbi:Rad52/Rad22 family DNA repair protein [Tomitella gaofuii]|uniref:Rad52/Rad22 family DNA repair protein n=1 Tax=Tomitella gaofuii TaxID=2760083 RepID=UPI0015FCAD2C|nr:Rad52/Rad22 family DNA repair protein [Tomitella gaofuii]